MKLDQHKTKILEEYRNTKNNIFISATAGSGKTTILVECMKQTPPNKKCLFLAFNKKIAEELRRRVPDFIDVNTVHAQSLKTLCSAYRSNFEIKDIQDFLLAKEVVNTEGIKSINSYLFMLAELFNFIKLNILETDTEVQEWCDENGFGYSEEILRDITLMRGAYERKLSAIKYGKNIPGTFTDMLYITYKLLSVSKYPKYDVVFIDELQDIAPLHREIALRFLKPTGRLVTVGDDKQCIYGFQGANLKSFNYFRERPNTVSLPLSITYRCAQKIVEEANKVFDKSIVALPNSVYGEVRLASYKEARQDDYIICRNNAPLFEAYIYFLQEKRACSIIGRDIENGLLSLLEKIKKIEDLENILEAKRDSLQKKGIRNVEYNPSYILLSEQVSILITLYGYFGRISSIRDAIKIAFTEKNNSIVLSTIHKAKGLEANRVFLLKPDLLPSKYARTNSELYNEKCLKFVAITRAKHEFIYCTD